jgi:hypothetical protein
MTENCKLRRAILSAFYNISQRNFGILLILWCSFKLWWNFCLDQNFSYKVKGPLKYQTNNAATTALSWIINSLYFEYRNPIRLRNNFINPKWLFLFRNPNESDSDLHTSSRYILTVLDALHCELIWPGKKYRVSRLKDIGNKKLV